MTRRGSVEAVLAKAAGGGTMGGEVTSGETASDEIAEGGRASGETAHGGEVVVVRIEPVLRHGKGSARLPGAPSGYGHSVDVAFALPGERVEAALRGRGRKEQERQERQEAQLMRVLKGSAERVEPLCPHFGVCGGCQLQMASAAGQLRMKQAVLLDWLARAAVGDVPEVQVHAAQPWGYRNRIRLRVGLDETGALRLGYNERGSRRFLPVRTCPIGAPLLWRAAQAVLAACADSAEWTAWLRTTAEVEFFADSRCERLQLLLLREGSAPAKAEVTFARAMDALRARLPELVGAGAVLLGPPQRGEGGVRERTRTPCAAWGTAGLGYEVSSEGSDEIRGHGGEEDAGRSQDAGRGKDTGRSQDTGARDSESSRETGNERFWVARGGFFQVNRFLLPELVRLVCRGRSGELAWDLFAGVGLFARVLARSFARVTAVEGNPAAAWDLRAALAKLDGAHRAVEAATLDFLRDAAVQRERPGLITLDPPRAGAGVDCCELLLRLGAPEMVYVSCDPETLARDLAVLERGYRLTAVHLLDMFPQTYHQETVVMLERRP